MPQAIGSAGILRAGNGEMIDAAVQVVGERQPIFLGALNFDLNAFCGGTRFGRVVVQGNGLLWHEGTLERWT